MKPSPKITINWNFIVFGGFLSAILYAANFYTPIPTWVVYTPAGATFAFTAVMRTIAHFMYDRAKREFIG